MLVKSYAAAVQGISATVVTIEVNCTKGIQFFLVGLPDVAVRERLPISGRKVRRMICRLRSASWQQPKSWMLPG